MRVPALAQAELDELRQRAEAGGYDLAESMSEAVVRIIRQISAELRRRRRHRHRPITRGATASDVARAINGTASES